MTTSTLQRFPTKDLHLHAYKVHLTQQLRPQAMHSEESSLTAQKIIFSDEAHFQNCRIWGLENPRMIYERTMHPQRVTVWCELWSGGIIGPFFFEDEEGNAVTVNGERYRAMTNQVCVPQLEDIAVDDK